MGFRHPTGCQDEFSAPTGRNEPPADPRSTQTTPITPNAKHQVNAPGRIFGTHRITVLAALDGAGGPDLNGATEILLRAALRRS
jgi:hypothetical protein